jgi:hypothetical protein
MPLIKDSSASCVRGKGSKSAKYLPSDFDQTACSDTYAG